MNNREMTDQAKEIKEEVGVDLFTRNLLMLLFLAVTVGYLLLTHGMFGEIDLSFALIALIACGLIVYAGSMAKLVLRGRMVQPVGDCVYVLTPAVVMAAVFAFGPKVFPSFLNNMAVPSILLGSVLSAEMIAKARQGPAWLALRAMALVIAALLVQTLAAGMGMPDLGGAVLIGASLAASLSLVALFKEHSDRRWRTLGRAMGSTRMFLISSSLIILSIVYLMYLRPIWMASDGAAVMMVEWIIIGVAVLILALLARQAMKDQPSHPKLSLEDLMKGQVKVKGDQAKVVEAMTGFVASGSKDRVLVLLISVLRDNGLSDEEVAKVVGRLANYHEDEIPLTWAWTYGDLMVKRRRDRSRLMRETLEQAGAVVEMSATPAAPVTVTTE